MDMLDSESDREDDRSLGRGQKKSAAASKRTGDEYGDDDGHDSADPERLSDFGDSGDDHEPGFIAQFAEVWTRQQLIDVATQ